MRLAAIALLFAIGCPGPPPPPPPAPAPAPPPPPPPPPPPVAALPPVPDLEAPNAPPPPAAFRRTTAISFRDAGGYKLARVAGDARVMALSPDGLRMVLGTGKGLSLRTVGQSSALPIVGNDKSLVVFSYDGSLVAVGDESIRVHDATSGALRAGAKLTPCALRFDSNEALLVHDKGDAAMLRRVDLASGAVEGLGGQRKATECVASLNGMRWIVTTSGRLSLVDGTNGRSRILGAGRKHLMASPGADRWCSVSPTTTSEVWCERVSDGGREILLAAARFPELRFDPHGKRAIVGSSVIEERGNPRLEWSVVDFASRELRPLVGFWQGQGSLPKLLPEGELLAMGGPKGMSVFDLRRGEKRYASVPGRPLYAAYPLLGHTRRWAAGSESPSGSLSEDAYLAEFP